MTWRCRIFMLKMSAMRCMHWAMCMLRSVFGRWICCDGQVRGSCQNYWVLIWSKTTNTCVLWECAKPRSAQQRRSRRMRRLRFRQQWVLICRASMRLSDWTNVLLNTSSWERIRGHSRRRMCIAQPVSWLILLRFI